MSVGGVRMGINYGLNRVRFISPVPSGARVRGRFSLTALDDIKGGVQATWSVTVERESGRAGDDKPYCSPSGSCGTTNKNGFVIILKLKIKERRTNDR